MTLDCEGSERRQLTRSRGFNGLDYVEVKDDYPRDELYLYFLDRAPANLNKTNVRIEGGAQITNIRVLDVRTHRGEEGFDDYISVKLDRPGDVSTYTVRLVNMPDDAKIDPRYDHLTFSFMIDCAAELDCKAAPEDAPAVYETPEIDYLAKDYAGFRQLILDRLSLIMPNWRERHVPDIGIALVEILAYVGDHLSYYQDAVATEAYIGTARQRISVRRHARLIDYLMHEGHNARAWVHIRLEGAASQDINLSSLYFITPVSVIEPGTLLAQSKLAGIARDQYEVFEPLTKQITLYESHNEIHFYTWGNHHCCLEYGATRATLIDYPAPTVPDGETPAGETPVLQTVVGEQPGSSLHLQAGDVLIFEEVIGPETANPADADMRRRHAVRLTRVTPGFDPVAQQAVLEIEWHLEDALPFELCISTTSPAPQCELLTNVSVARGNIILADHGRRIVDEDLGEVLLKTVTSHCEGDDCGGEPYPVGITRVPHNFRPRLGEIPLVFSQPLPPDNPDVVSAAALLKQDARHAMPQVWLASMPWNPSGRLIGQLDDAPTLESLARQIKAGETYDGGYLRRLLSTATLDALDAWDGTSLLTTELRGALISELMTEWVAKPDLLNSRRTDTHFVAEIDNDGRAHLRFGDGEMGRKPAVGERFTAVYRIGGRAGGNIGAGALSQIVLREGHTLSGVKLYARNPLAAARATPPETMDEVRLAAPYTFSAESEMQRAIIADDYARLVERDFASRVQRAAAQLRWTGSWYEALVVVDPKGGVNDPALLRKIEQRLYRYRRIGHDLAVRWAQHVPLDILLSVCALPNYAQGDVKAALLKALGRGEMGFFHPDNMTFGGTLSVSRLVAAAQSVPGVEDVSVIHMRRKENTEQPLIPPSGILKFGAFEIARCDNDPSMLENGSLNIIMRGGR